MYHTSCLIIILSIPVLFTYIRTAGQGKQLIPVELKKSDICTTVPLDRENERESILSKKKKEGK